MQKTKTERVADRHTMGWCLNHVDVGKRRLVGDSSHQGKSKLNFDRTSDFSTYPGTR